MANDKDGSDKTSNPENAGLDDAAVVGAKVGAAFRVAMPDGVAGALVGLVSVNTNNGGFAEGGDKKQFSGEVSTSKPRTVGVVSAAIKAVSNPTIQKLLDEQPSILKVSSKVTKTWEHSDHNSVTPPSTIDTIGGFRKR